MSATYEVLSPSPEVDPVPVEGICPRLPDLRGKRIGLFNNDKVAARPILDAVERGVGARVDGCTFARFGRSVGLDVAETPGRARYLEWVKRVDAVVLAVAD